MGNCCCYIFPRYSCCIGSHDQIQYTSTPSSKKNRKNLSAAFNLWDADSEYSVELLNINTATEEELMTLPSINRQTAHNIVDYRQQIGNFKKVEDLALVSGVGATKFNQLKMEVCVRRRSAATQDNSCSSRLDISGQDDISRCSTKNSSRFMTLVNVNTTNVFQLMKVKGILQVTAENIVSYREQKGQFNNLDDLLKVKGINIPLLSAIRPYLVLQESNNVILNGNIPSRTENVANHCSASDIIAPEGLDDDQKDLISLYGPLLTKSFRSVKVIPPQTVFEYDVFRIASWNLDKCGFDKASNPGVKEVFVMTVLENRWSIVAVQDLLDEIALQKLCDELNNPTLPILKKRQLISGSWKCFTSDSIQENGSQHVGFLYESSVALISTQLVECYSSYPFISPYVAVFQMKSEKIAVVNILFDKLAVQLLEPEFMKTSLTSLAKILIDIKMIVILGHFGLSPNSIEFSPLIKKDYQAVISDSTATDISIKKPGGSSCLDNIWLNTELRTCYAGNCGVVRDDLTSPWIPDGWGWGGVISSSCPIWIELKL